MENVKVVRIKGKYQYKQQKSIYQGCYRILHSGAIRDAVFKLKPDLINAVLTKKTPGDTHYIIMEE